MKGKDTNSRNLELALSLDPPWGANALVEKGAQAVYVCCTHPVLSGQAVKMLMESPIEEMIVTDTIPLREEAIACPKIKVLSISSLLAEAIRRIYEDESVSCLFV